MSLDDVRVSSPCRSDWDSMYGDDRRRFCAECKLNVYNLSGMTRDEAEQLVMNAEGRLCVRFFRRKDGTILTQDCPVGWRALKKRVSRVAVAMSSMMIGFFTGVFSLRAVDSAIASMPVGHVEQPDYVEQPVLEKTTLPVVGELAEWEGQGELGGAEPIRITVGRIRKIERVEDVKVKARVK